MVDESGTELVPATNEIAFNGQEPVQTQLGMIGKRGSVTCDNHGNMRLAQTREHFLGYTYDLPYNKPLRSTYGRVEGEKHTCSSTYHPEAQHTITACDQLCGASLPWDHVCTVACTNCRGLHHRCGQMKESVCPNFHLPFETDCHLCPVDANRNVVQPACSRVVGWEKERQKDPNQPRTCDHDRAVFCDGTQSISCTAPCEQTYQLCGHPCDMICDQHTAKMSDGSQPFKGHTTCPLRCGKL